MASSPSSWLPPSTRSSDAGPTLADARPPCPPADDPDTLLDAARRWEPPAASAERRTPVVPVLPDSEPTPLVLPAPPADAPAPAPAVASALPASPPMSSPVSTDEHAPPDPPSAWLSSRRRRRPLPRGIKVAAAGAAGVLLLVVIAGRGGGSTTKTIQSSAAAVDDALVVNGNDLRKRKEMTPEDFRAPARVRVRESAPALGAAPASAIDVDLKARRTRRTDNPEDLKAPGRAHPPTRRAVPRARETARELVWVAPVIGASDPAADEAPRRLVAAASRVRVTLPRAVRLRGGRTNVVARVGKGEALPAGTKLLGTARLDRDGRAHIAFRTVVLPSGQQLRVDAEAEGDDGGAGVWAVLDEPADEEADDGSVAGDVADGTARRVARRTFGDGIVGGAVDDTFRARDRRPPRRRRAELTGTLPAGTDLYILFLAEVVLEP